MSSNQANFPDCGTECPVPPQHFKCFNTMPTLPCNPSFPQLWNSGFENVPQDAIKQNVVNGCQLCNFSQEDEENKKLCNRSFFNGIYYPPCKTSFS